VRDEVVSCVGYWSEKCEFPVSRFLNWLGLSRGKFRDWVRRAGQENAHNARAPRRFWLLPGEMQAITEFAALHHDTGYRRLSYMMLDADIAAVSPATVYRVLDKAGLMPRHPSEPSRKGQGFDQPLLPHEHWHIDISYVNLQATFYYLFSVLDGASRYIVHWELRTSAVTSEVETMLQRAREKFPDARPRIISDNGPQFVAREFKEFIRVCGMSHVRTSPYYPQSNGKIERYHRSLKTECLRPGTPLDVEDARRLLSAYVEQYNTVRLHAGIGYITPQACLLGLRDEILAQRRMKLHAARERRQQAVSTPNR